MKNSKVNYKSISKQLRKSLRGRIKLRTLHNISNSKKRFPSSKQLKSFINKLKDSPDDPYALFLYYTITLNQVSDFDYHDILFNNRLEVEYFEYLKENFLDDCIIVNFKNCKDPLPSNLCLWIIKSGVKESFRLTIFICGEESPDFVEAIFEISISDNNNTINFKVFQSQISKYRTHLSNRFKDELLEGIVMRIPHFLVDRMPTLLCNTEVSKNPNKFHQIQRSYDRPIDIKLIKLLRQVSNNKIKCYKVKVSISDIQLYDIDYALSIPENAIENFVSKIDKIKEFGLLTYQVNDKYIVSDDYELYLAMRITEMEYVNIVNLGRVNSSAEIIQEGGLELIPPMMSQSSSIDASDEFKLDLLNNKIELFKRSKKLKKLMFDNYEDIKEMISNNKLEDAILELMEFTQIEDVRNELISIKGQLKKLKSDIRLGIINYETETINFNKIRINILRILNEI